VHRECGWFPGSLDGVPGEVAGVGADDSRPPPDAPGRARSLWVVGARMFHAPGGRAKATYGQDHREVGFHTPEVARATGQATAGVAAIYATVEWAARR